MKRNRDYQTQGKRKVFDYAQRFGEPGFTAKDVFSHYRGTGDPVSYPTVYRQLDKLTENGVLKKHRDSDGDSSVYFYRGKQDGPDSQPLLKCVSCGKLLPLQCNVAKGLAQHVDQKHGFHIDMSETVFYGTCSSCAALNQQNLPS